MRTAGELGCGYESGNKNGIRRSGVRNFKTNPIWAGGSDPLYSEPVYTARAYTVSPDTARPYITSPV